MWDGGEADVRDNMYFFLLLLLAELNCMSPTCTERRVGGVGVKSGQIILMVVGMGGEGTIRLLP